MSSRATPFVGYTFQTAAGALVEGHSTLPRRFPVETLAPGMTAAKLARYVELAITGTKSAYPSMRPADAFLRDAEAMLRTLIAGAVAPSKAKKPSPSARPVRRQGVRK